MAWEIEALIGAFFTISLYSLVFKDTPLFRFAERTFIGLSMGVTVTMTWVTIKNQVIAPIMGGNFRPLIPAILGLMMLLRYSKSYKWLDMYPVAIMAMVGLSLQARTAVEAYIVSQITSVASTKFAADSLYQTTGNIFFFVSIIAGLAYFLFATEELPGAAKTTVGYLAKLGRYTMLMFLGASFANVLLGRESMFLERIYFLLKTFGLVT